MRSGVLALALVAFAVPARAQLAPNARAYLSGALDTIQAVTMGRDTIDWRLLRDSALYYAEGARTPRETWGAVFWALQRANRHSFLQAERPGLVTELLPGPVGYLRVPQRGGAAVSLADSLHSAVRDFAAAGACGWIVDLRSNGGGNMWPMLAGIGPLLGDSIVGFFGTASDAERWFYRDGVSAIGKADGAVDAQTRITGAPVATIDTRVPVAVLVDGGTASSGEAVAVAFQGRPNVRFFGTPTAGFATTNRGSRLAEGANMVVTTGYYANRLRVQQPLSVQPDEVVRTVLGWPFPTDRTAAAASKWLRAQAPCRAEH